MTAWFTIILLMEEILHHLGCMKPCRNGIFSILTGAGFLPSTVCYHDTWLIMMKFDWMDHVGDPAQQWSSCQRSRKGSETGTARIYSFGVWALPRPWLGLNTCFWWDVLLRWRSVLFFQMLNPGFLPPFWNKKKWKELQAQSWGWNSQEIFPRWVALSKRWHVTS